jgi:phosphoribosyl 1,2-cyclic phosphodiesterase
LLRFTSLASGSTGNATLVEARRSPDDRPTRLLVDCGLAPRRLAAALATRGVTPAEIDAVFVTHEHSDHLGGVLALQRRHQVAVWTSSGTWNHATARLSPAERAGATAQCVSAGVALAIGALTLYPFAVPHDAAEPLQLVVSDGQQRLGIVTDLGEPTDAVALALADCDALLLEANHDREMLDAGAYPSWLKRRIGGRQGHLSNAQSATLLDACVHLGLRHVVAAHLSRQNNRPELACAALAPVLGAGTTLHLADGDQGCRWIDLG